MRRLLLVAAIAALAALPVRASQIELRYSKVYDDLNYGQVAVKYPSAQEIDERVEYSQKLWAKNEKIILQRIRVVTGKKLSTKHIVVYLVGYGRGISDPLTISLFKFPTKGEFTPDSDEQFLRNMTHELLHHLVQQPCYGALWKRLESEYPDELPVVTNHVFVIGLETRLYGYADVAQWYAPAREEYRRALTVAKNLNLTTEHPVR